VTARGSEKFMGPNGWNPNPHLKGDVVGRAMEGSVVSMLNIEESLIPFFRVIGIIHG